MIVAVHQAGPWQGHSRAYAPKSLSHPAYSFLQPRFANSAVICFALQMAGKKWTWPGTAPLAMASGELALSPGPTFHWSDGVCVSLK